MATQTRESTKDRIMFASAELFRRQGYAGTGLKQILAEADAPFGSLYHFFPGGKEQLGDEVIRMAGAFFRRLLETVADEAADVETAVTDFFEGAGQTLVDTGYADACPIGTVALEVASTNETLRRATADVFESWIDAVGERGVEAGLPPPRARALALSIVALIEGGFMLSRAARDIEPMRAAGETAAAAVRAALSEQRG